MQWPMSIGSFKGMRFWRFEVSKTKPHYHGEVNIVTINTLIIWLD